MKLGGLRYLKNQTAFKFFMYLTGEALVDK